MPTSTSFASRTSDMRYNLSEITSIIKDRRTIFPEQFSSRKVHREQVEMILNNAIWAPTHGMTEPWRFKVFMGESREKLAEGMVKAYDALVPADQQKAAKRERLAKRPTMSGGACIVVTMEHDPDGKIPEHEDIMAVACAVQNMHLTCTAAGLGLFWSTPKLMWSKEANPYLDLPTDQRIIGVIYVGYPEKEWPKRKHRKPLEYITDWNE